MPNRILKDSICTSEEIDHLAPSAEALFYRLLVTVDDFGRFDGRLKVIASRCYPLKSIDIKSLASDINCLQMIGLVFMYQVDGKPFLQVVNWAKHQQIRAKRPKFPAPEDGSEITCEQLISDDYKCARNPIQSNPIRRAEKQTATPDGFAEFWSAYPKKVGKGAAETAWKKQKPPVADALAAVEAQKSSDSWRKDNGQYIPNPATWLNQKRWLDGEQSRSSIFAGVE